MTNLEKQIGDYILEKEIGIGGFAQVIKGTHIPTGEKVAIKVLNKLKLMEDPSNLRRLEKEIAILKKVKHKNIVKLYEVMESPLNIYLVMEYCEGGELFDYIVLHKRLTEKQSCIFFQQIINALEYLHSQGIVHRDIKPENMLLDKTNDQITIKLIDFGISNYYGYNELLKTPCGTTAYAPPEMHKGQSYSGMLSDIWSAGIVLYAMVYGYLPFCEDEEEKNIENIIKGDYNLDEDVSYEVRDLIRNCLEIDLSKRYDFIKIKEHLWFNLVDPNKILRFGIIVGFHKIPIDERILEICKEFGYEKDKVKNSVANNKFDRNSSIYYITLKKIIKIGYDSISDLFSENYINYMKSLECFVEEGVSREETRKGTKIKESSSGKKNYNKSGLIDIKGSISEKKIKYNNNKAKEGVEFKIRINLKKKRNDKNFSNKDSFKEVSNSSCLSLKNNFALHSYKNIHTIEKKKYIKKIIQSANVKEKLNISHFKSIENPKKNNAEIKRRDNILTINRNDHTIIHNRNASLIVSYKFKISSHLNHKIPKIRELSFTKKSEKKKLNKNGLMKRENNNPIITNKVKFVNIYTPTKSRYVDYKNNIQKRFNYRSNMNKREISLYHSHKSSLESSLNNSAFIKSYYIRKKIPKIDNINSTSLVKPYTSFMGGITISNRIKTICAPLIEQVSEFCISHENIKYYSGPVDISLIILKDIKSIKEYICECLKKNKISFKKTSSYKYHCSKYGNIFNIEIRSLDCNKKNKNNVYYLLIREKNGNLCSGKFNFLKSIFF